MFIIIIIILFAGFIAMSVTLAIGIEYLKQLVSDFIELIGSLLP